MGTLLDYAKLALRAARARIANARVDRDISRLGQLAREGAPASEREAQLLRALADGDAFDVRAAAVSAMGEQLPGPVARVERSIGRANPDVLPVHELSDAQRIAAGTLFERFQDSAALGLAPGTLAPGVQPTSPHVLHAVGGALRSSHSSVDAVGAPNVEHVGSVLRGVLERSAAARGRPLTQFESDELTLQTVLTDAWMKGRTLAELKGARTLPTSAGETVEEIHHVLQAQAKARFDAAGPASAPVRAVVHGWMDDALMPMSADGVRDAARAAGLTGPQTEELLSAWSTRLMANGDWANVQGFMRGVLLHGLHPFEPVEHVVAAAGRGHQAAVVYYSDVTHNVAGFITGGLGKAGVLPDFFALEARGQIPRGAAERLTALFKEAEAVNARWRPRIEEAVAKGRGLTPAQRDAYRAEASPLRSALERIPFDGRSQLENDDAMQFTQQGLPKWIQMQQGGTNAQTLRKVYASAQAYFEEARARDLLHPGQELVARSEEGTRRLGMVFDPKTELFREALPQEPAHQTLAALLAADPELSARFLASGGAKDASAAARVAWFREQPVDPQALIRLAHAPLP